MCEHGAKPEMLSGVNNGEDVNLEMLQNKMTTWKFSLLFCLQTCGVQSVKAAASISTTTRVYLPLVHSESIIQLSTNRVPRGSPFCLFTHQHTVCQRGELFHLPRALKQYLHKQCWNETLLALRSLVVIILYRPMPFPCQTHLRAPWLLFEVCELDLRKGGRVDTRIKSQRHPSSYRLRRGQC